MNRLILVGNGFDLAHGLKTSYKDFIFWYLDSCILGAGTTSKDKYSDRLIEIKPWADYYTIMALRNAYGKLGICSHFDKNGGFNKFFNIYGEESLTYGNSGETEFEPFTNERYEITYKSNLLVNLIRTCLDCNWVDVENEYFETLKRCKNKEGQFDFKKVNQLNDELQFIKGKLKEYLEIQQKNAGISVKGNLIAHIKSKYNISDFDTTADYENLRQRLGFDDRFKEEDHHLCVVNFNYTDTFNHYKNHVIEQSIFRKVEINHIHGELYELTNPLIFGFGDEHDKDYLTFEEQGNNDLFEHIKSYQYFKTPNYRSLVRFLNSGDYQVFIMGHSCGLSDRTMFKEIFDHDNCKSVKIFHYQKSDGTNDFWEKTVNLGRHFSDKGRMRKLIVEFNEANVFP